jgi:hypothetical protein
MCGGCEGGILLCGHMWFVWCLGRCMIRVTCHYQSGSFRGNHTHGLLISVGVTSCDSGPKASCQWGPNPTLCLGRNQHIPPLVHCRIKFLIIIVADFIVRKYE